MEPGSQAVSLSKYRKSSSRYLAVGLVLGTLIVAIASLSLSIENSVLRLSTEFDQEAHVVVAQHMMFQVAAAQCRERNSSFLDLYNGYVRRHSMEIQSSIQRLARLKSRQSGHAADPRSLLADLGAHAALEARLDYPGFCDESYRRLQVIMSDVETGGLTEFTVPATGVVGPRFAARLD